MQVEAKEIINWYGNGYKDEVTKVHTLSGSSLAECFRKVYELERGVRYVSNIRYEFCEPEMKEKYQAWVRENETIELYYGSATVD